MTHKPFAMMLSKRPEATLTSWTPAGYIEARANTLRLKEETRTLKRVLKHRTNTGKLAMNHCTEAILQALELLAMAHTDEEQLMLVEYIERLCFQGDIDLARILSGEELR